MIRAVISGCFLLAAGVNLVPVSGVLSLDRMQAAYGVTLSGANLEVLMRHRALLFGVVGGLLAVAAFRPALRPTAAAAGLFSMLSFAALVFAVGEVNPSLQRLAVVDVAASGVLAAGVLLDRRLGHD